MLYAQLLIVVAGWCFLHSWLASVPVKEFVSRRMPPAFSAWYRLLYNVVAGFLLFPVALVYWRLPDITLYMVPPPSQWIMYSAQGLAALGLLVAATRTGSKAFIGIVPASSVGAPVMQTGGLYGIVRHPIYLFGALCMLLAPSMSMKWFLVSVEMIFYMWIGARLEETRLIREFGQRYVAYREQVPMFLPRLGFGRRSGRKLL